MTSDLTATSRFLSYILRHNPSAIGASLDEAGWISIDTLLAATGAHGHSISRDTLTQLTSGPGKRRFEIRGNKIRAAQGHSIPIDLQLSPSQPPATLYHGTVERYLPRILAEGLKPGQRSHVHLSPDPTTATAVAARRGHPVILAINAAGMHNHGHQFYRASNGVWLTSHVPPQWIHRHTPQ
jgi:putative RNA 2'-phosphotransferase